MTPAVIDLGKAVPDAAPEHAATNIAAFRDAVAAAVADDDVIVENAQPDGVTRDDGRYGYRLTTADGAQVHILMPAAPLAAVRDDLSCDAPCLAVDGEWFWWLSAVTLTAGHLRG